MVETREPALPPGTCHSFSFFVSFKSIKANNLINDGSYQIYFCVKTFSGPKSKSVLKGVQIGFEMAEKNANTHTHTFLYLY